MSFFVKYRDDIVYVAFLFLSVALGACFRKLKCANQKKIFGTAVGIVVILCVSGTQALHPIVSGLIGIACIKLLSIRYCHLVSFVIMFGYLFFIRFPVTFGVSPVSGHTNLIMMLIVFRVVGVAFEMNGSRYPTKQRKRDEKEVQGMKDDDYVELINPSVVDLVHYTFSFVGLLTGPYIRYRTFDDFNNLPFSESVDTFAFTVNRLKFVPLYVSLYLAISNLWPLSYLESEPFEECSFLYRAMYSWPIFSAFRMRIYAGLTLAECVCTSAGMGAYPIQGNSRSGHGPTVNYLQLKQMSAEVAKTQEYDFNTIHSIDTATEWIPSYRESMKFWNKCVQYWVGMYVYKRFPVKVLRTHVTLLVSVIWHGFHAGYFFCIYSAPFYLVAEDIYDKLYIRNAKGMAKNVINFIAWFMRMHYQSYGGTAFVLLSFDRVWKYYSSVYHYPYFVWLVLLILGLVLKSQQRTKRTKEAEVGTVPSDSHVKTE